MSIFSFDVGCVLATCAIPVPDDVFREELSALIAAEGADLMVKVLRDLDAFEESKRPQGEDGVTYGEAKLAPFYFTILLYIHKASYLFVH